MHVNDVMFVECVCTQPCRAAKPNHVS